MLDLEAVSRGDAAALMDFLAEHVRARLHQTSVARSDGPETLSEAGGLDVGGAIADAMAEQPDWRVLKSQPPLHPWTGTFADPQLAAEFRSTVFRRMFPLHVAIMGLTCCVGLAVAVADRAYPVVATLEALSGALLAVGLWARIVVHRWEDATRAQALGATTWTTVCVISSAVELLFVALTPASICPALSESDAMYVYPLYTAAFALVNASHGLEFWHASSLVGLIVFECTTEAIVCEVSPGIGALLVMAPAAHFTQLLARGDFLKLHYLRESRDRLIFQAQLSSHREHQADTRRQARRNP